ncbi:MAG: phospholipid/cholesterol/gamma-HCH transport system substrate-binding protein, partial [Solirubrobacteraceae bacterium]|nr:phospholipid/cholesterol/gamma-HCH transport system substrate-binding protein [Solirubrobacteraceae bacterium]
MVKQAPTLRRLLVMVGFALSCFGLLLFLWLAFGGPIPLQAKGYRFKVRFNEATQLAKEADVRISGVPVGKVKTIEFVRDGRCLPSETGAFNGACSEATIELRRRYAPLPTDARAILRQKTLLG